MIKALIVDDEQHAREYLRKTIEERYSDVRVLALCRNVEEAEEAIVELKPNLVFLDVELGKGVSSFDLLKRLPPLNFAIIFVTAYNQYAIQAIRFSAIDYLLKPIDYEELDVAIAKFRERTIKEDSHKIESLLSAWTSPGDQQNKMPLPTMTGFDLVTIADIIFCESDSNQTRLVLSDNSQLFVSLTLQKCEQTLKSYRFFRVHKSFLVNLNHVRKYLKGKDGTVIMSNGSNITVSRNFKEEFLLRMKTP